MWTADKRPLGCKLELGLDVQNPAKRCNFSDIQFSDVVRVPRPADPGPSSILQSSTFGGPLDLVKISQIRSEIRSRAKRCNFSDIFGHFRTFSDIRSPGSTGSKIWRKDVTFRTHFGHISDTFRTHFGHISDIQFCPVVRVPRPAYPKSGEKM